MILKITFYDNDFTHIIEEFLDKWQYNVFMYDVLTSIDQYERYDEQGKYFDAMNDWRDRNNLIHKDKYDEYDVGKLVDLFKMSFTAYLKDVHSDKVETLLETLNIECVRYVKSKDLNSEVVYYFTKQNRYITM